MYDGGEVAVLAGDHEQVHGHLQPGAVQRQRLLEVSAWGEQRHHLALLAGGGLPVGHLAGLVEGRLPGTTVTRPPVGLTIMYVACSAAL